MKYLLSLAWLLLALVPGWSARAAEVYVACWNVENLFDAVDDPGRDDDWLKDWTPAHYAAKLNQLASIIKAMNDGAGPDLLGLVEVENRQVVEDLARLLGQPGEYRVVHHDAKAGRGLEVALLSRLPVLDSKSVFTLPGVRDILQVTVDAHGYPLHLLVNHWKSRLGGVVATQHQRLICASRAYQLYYELVGQDAQAELLVMGDFNDAPLDPTITEGLRALPAASRVLGSPERAWLYNATTELLTAEPPGTHNYDGQWQFLDQVVLSPGLLEVAGIVYQARSLAVFNPDQRLLQAGVPQRIAASETEFAGYSDHLPLVARLVIAEPRPPLAPRVRGQAFSTALWAAHSAEYQALCEQAYQLARRALDAALAKLPAGGKPTVILDLDETVLDNRPWNLATAITGLPYQPERWADWAAQGCAELLPGAGEFLRYADAQGVTLWYLSNRSSEGAEGLGTQKNLARLQVPQSGNLRLRPPGEQGKEKRRLYLAEDHQILLLIGDNLADFAEVWEGTDHETRKGAVLARRQEFGSRLILLPNPLYGDWTRALPGAREAAAERTAAQVHSILPMLAAWPKGLSLVYDHLPGVTRPLPYGPGEAPVLAPPAKPTPLDLNRATAVELEQLKGIGPVLAQAIIGHRTEHGPFTSLAQLAQIRGISQAMIAEWAEHLAVSPIP